MNNINYQELINYEDLTVNLTKVFDTLPREIQISSIRTQEKYILSDMARNMNLSLHDDFVAHNLTKFDIQELFTHNKMSSQFILTNVFYLASVIGELTSSPYNPLEAILSNDNTEEANEKLISTIESWLYSRLPLNIRESLQHDLRNFYNSVSLDFAVKSTLFNDVYMLISRKVIDNLFFSVLKNITVEDIESFCLNIDNFVDDPSEKKVALDAATHLLIIKKG